MSLVAICGSVAPTDSHLGGNVRYDRGKGACSGQKEGGDKDKASVRDWWTFPGGDKVSVLMRGTTVRTKA